MKRQFDVFQNPDSATATDYPLFIILQSDAVDQLSTRVVAPLISPRSMKLFEKLLPRVIVDRKQYVIAIPDLGVMPIAQIGPVVASLGAERERIIAALDLLFTGI